MSTFPKPDPIPPPKSLGIDRPTALIAKLDWMEPFRFVWSSSKWFVNILLLSLCGMIPVVGVMVILGYQYQVIEALHLRRERKYPDFDFGRFSSYLVRGIWPFLSSLLAAVISIPMVIGFVIVFAGLTVAFGDGGGHRGGGDWAPIQLFITLASYPMFLIVFVGAHLLVTPLVIAAKLTGDTNYAFDFGFAFDFLSKTWVDMLLVAIATAFGGMLVACGGLLLFCVGAYLVTGVMALVNAHFEFQLYEIYLTRGGRRLPLKPLEP
jgi:hypothetical protein